MDATWWVPQSLPRLLPWSFAIFAVDMRSDVAVVDAGAIGLLTILRVDGDASGVDENGATFVAREGVVDVVKVDADLGLVNDVVEVVEVDSIRTVVDEVVDVVVADAISAAGGGVVGAAAADAGATAAGGAIAVDLSTPQLSTK